MLWSSSDSKIVIVVIMVKYMVHSVLIGNGLLIKLSIHVVNIDLSQPLWFVKK